MPMHEFSAKPFTVTQSDDYRQWEETRWRIVNTETGEVVDDAQGYGYKTAPKAYAAFGYKQKPKKHRKKPLKLAKTVQAWANRNSDFSEDLSDLIFQALKAGNSGQTISQLIMDAYTKYVATLPAAEQPKFSAVDFRRHWIA